MNRPGLVIAGKATAIAISAVALLAAGCASQGDVENSAERPQPCPSNMALECFESPTRPTQCSCVSSQELEQMMEQVLGKIGVLDIHESFDLFSGSATR